jgi:hypothetical protein
MFKKRIFFITTASLVLAWLVLSLVLGSYHAATDGYNSIGVPAVFYRSFAGKCFDCLPTGILWEGLVMDLVLVLVLAVLTALFLRKRRRPAKK